MVDPTHYVKIVPIRSFSGPNAGKYGPEKLLIRIVFHVDNFLGI